MSTTLNEDVIGRVRSVVATALKVDLDPVGADDDLAEALGGRYDSLAALEAVTAVENEDDLRMTYDFRDVFGTVMENWLNVPAAQLVPGGALLPSTAATDPDGDSYTAYNSIGFL